MDLLFTCLTSGLFCAGSFLVSFSFHEPNAEEGGRKVQAFLTEMEGAIRDHPLWASATNQEIDHALEVKIHSIFFLFYTTAPLFKVAVCLQLHFRL
jgi:hypothetical protein